MKRQRDFKRALQACEENPYCFPPLNDADIRHLRRWSEDSRCEQIWQRLSKLLHVEPNYESWVRITLGLIHVVLAARNEAEANEPSTGLKKAVRTHAEARWSALATFRRRAKTALSGKGDYPALWRERAKLLRQAADFFDELAISRPKLVLNVDRNGSRKRQRFSARLSKHLHLRTGRWCDEEVATLTEIAFPGKKDVTIDMIRAARKKYC